MTKHLSIIILIIFLSACRSFRKQNTDVIAIDYVRADYKGNPYNDIFGIGIERHWKQADKTIKIEYLTTDGHSAYLKESNYPYYPHEYRFDYNDLGKLLKKTAYDSVGNIINVDTYHTPAITKYDYNTDGNLIEVSRLDKDGKLIGVGDRGVSIDRYGYNRLGRIIWKKSYPTDEKFVITHLGYTYNQNNELASQVYYQEDNSVANKFVYLKFNNENEPLIVENYNSEGKLIGKFWFEYADSNLTSSTTWYYKWDQKKTSKILLEFDVAGWLPEPMESIPLSFENYGNGAFDITVDEKGKIIDAEVTGSLQGSENFKQEVFQYLRGVVLSKDGTEIENRGKFKVSILKKFPVKITDDLK